MQRRRRPKKKGRATRAVILWLLLGLGVLGGALFYREITQPIRSWLETKGLLRGERAVVLYFADPEEDLLVEERREIPKRDDVEEEAEELIGALVRGPRGKLVPTLPPRVRLLGLQIDERGVARVNFSKELSKDHPGGSSGEILTVYSIVNSLTRNFPQIKRVQLLIEGKRVETIAGHLSVVGPVQSNPELIKKSSVEKEEKRSDGR